MYFTDGAVQGSRNFGFHFHGFQHQDGLAFLHRVTLFHFDGGDHARQRGAQFAAAAGKVAAEGGSEGHRLFLLGQHGGFGQHVVLDLHQIVCSVDVDAGLTACIFHDLGFIALAADDQLVGLHALYLLLRRKRRLGMESTALLCHWSARWRRKVSSSLRRSSMFCLCMCSAVMAAAMISMFRSWG